MNEAGAVLFLRGADDSGWRLPGDMVQTGERVEAALWRALRQESIAPPDAGADLVWFYAGARAAPWDAVALYRINASGSPAPAEGAYFSADALAGACDREILARVNDAVMGRVPFEVC